tara:strand:+ start:602 stop:1183 length:582 start_codon:yes stop_codon:yes gene_type:complete
MVDREVQNAIKNQVPRVGKSALKKEINTKFKKIKKEMIQEFLSLPVTQELLGGPDAPNISGTLGGVTSLFAFIGFDSGDQPIAPILNALERTQLQYLKELKQTNKVGGVFTVTLPTAEQIFSITPMPWAIGRSWAQGIETGISGLGFLLRKKGKGRSGVALQSRVKVRGGRFRNTAYISSFIRKYEKRFQNLK